MKKFERFLGYFSERKHFLNRGRPDNKEMLSSLSILDATSGITKVMGVFKAIDQNNKTALTKPAPDLLQKEGVIDYK
jgi:hypothetical protein